MTDIMHNNISEKKLFIQWNSLFYPDFATAKSRGGFMTKLRFMDKRMQGNLSPKRQTCANAYFIIEILKKF